MSKYIVTIDKNLTELYHHGIKGQKKGQRRFQNPDGTLTEEGRKRYGVGKGKAKKSSNDTTEDTAKTSTPDHADVSTILKESSLNIKKSDSDNDASGNSKAKTKSDKKNDNDEAEKKKNAEEREKEAEKKKDEEEAEREKNAQEREKNKKEREKEEEEAHKRGEERKKEAEKKREEEEREKKENAREREKKKREFDDDDLKAVKNVTKEASNIANELSNMAGRKSVKIRRLNLDDLSDDQLRRAIQREQLEKQYDTMFNTKRHNAEARKERTQSFLQNVGGTLAITGSALSIALAVKQLRG